MKLLTVGTPATDMSGIYIDLLGEDIRSAPTPASKSTQESTSPQNTFRCNLPSTPKIITICKLGNYMTKKYEQKYDINIEFIILVSRNCDIKHSSVICNYCIMLFFWLRN